MMRTAPVAALLLSIAGIAQAEALGPKIIVGAPASHTEVSFQIALVQRELARENPYAAFQCGATFLGDVWALTAAHCVSEVLADHELDDYPPEGCLPDADRLRCTFPAERFAVLVGTELLQPGRGELVDVAEVIVHPCYARPVSTADAATDAAACAGSDPAEADYEHDIALLRLVSFPESPLRTANIPGPQDEFAEPPAGRVLQALGWGKSASDEPRSTRLLAAATPAVDRAVCDERFLFYAAWKNQVVVRVSANMLCAGAGAAEPAPDVCAGDSGGFVGAQRDDGTWVQLGIPSWQGECGEAYIFSVHTRVACYADWIELVRAGERPDIHHPEPLSCAVAARK